MARPGAPLQIITHAQRVCRLYKKAYRTKSDMFFGRYEIRISVSWNCNKFFTRNKRNLLTYNTIESDFVKDMWKTLTLVYLLTLHSTHATLKNQTLLHNFSWRKIWKVFRVLSEMRGKNLYIDPKKSKICIEIWWKCRIRFCQNLKFRFFKNWVSGKWKIGTPKPKFRFLKNLEK